MNGTQATRQAKPPPTGPTPPAPTSAPPVPPNQRQPTVNGTAHTNNPTTAAQSKTNKKKPADPQVDASQIYETLKNKIAALEEDAVHEEEEEKRFGTYHLSHSLNLDFVEGHALGELTSGVLVCEFS